MISFLKMLDQYYPASDIYDIRPQLYFYINKVIKYKFNNIKNRLYNVILQIYLFMYLKLVKIY